MNKSVEQRICIKFCQKLGKIDAETYEMLNQASGDEAKNGHVSLNDTVPSKKVSSS